MAKNQTRRSFLRVAPLAVAASLPLTDKLLFASAHDLNDGSNEDPASPSEGFQLFTADKLADAIKSFQSDPGEHYLYQPKTVPLTIAMTTQGVKKVGEFEYHEGRDHIFLILDGATKFEVGGVPKGPRNTRPGEWLAAASEGATTIEMKKGDMLVVTRGTPHRQSTEQKVTWMLISSSGSKDK